MAAHSERVAMDSSPPGAADPTGSTPAFVLPAARARGDLRAGPEEHGSAVVAVARRAREGDPIELCAGSVRVAMPFIPAVLTWSFGTFNLLTRVEEHRAAEELDHTREWICFPWPDSSEIAARQLLRETGSPWMGECSMDGMMVEAEDALNELAMGQKKLCEWQPRDTGECVVLQLEGLLRGPLVDRRRRFEDLILPSYRWTPPWIPTFDVIHAGSGSACWPRSWNEASDAELSGAAEWVERQSSDKLFDLTRNCAPAVVGNAFVPELRVWLRDTAFDLLQAMCAQPARVAACMRLRPRVRFSEQLDLSNEKELEAFQGLWADESGAIIMNLRRTMQPSTHLEVIVRWLVALTLSHVLWSFQHREDDGAHLACPICYERPRITYVMECGHQLCKSCAEKSHDGRDPYRILCHTCRELRTCQAFDVSKPAGSAGIRPMEDS